MAFVVEDGTGKSDANAYIDVTFYRSYFADRGVDVTAEQDADIQGRIIQATDYIELRWQGRLKGSPISQTQALHFPADAVYIGCTLQPSDEVPVNVKKACAELARLAKSGPLWVTPTVDPTGQTLASKREKIGPLEREWGYLAGSTSTTRPFPAADRYMRPLLTGQGGGVIRN